MSGKAEPDQDSPLPVWNAWAAAGDTFEERKRRLELAPQHLREQVEIHLRTVAQLRKRNQVMVRRAKEAWRG